MDKGTKDHKKTYKDFRLYSERLDEIMPTLPRFCDLIEKENETRKQLSEALDLLYGLVEYLGGRWITIEKYKFQENMDCVIFNPCRCRHFRPGRLGVSMIEDPEKNPDINKGSLEGIIGIGFDEEEDDYNKTASIMVTYQGKADYDDIELYPPEKWRDAIDEFFDIENIKKIEKRDYRLHGKLSDF